jgi:hypothetical protein
MVRHMGEGPHGHIKSSLRKDPEGSSGMLCNVNSFKGFINARFLTVKGVLPTVDTSRYFQVFNYQ